MTRLYSLLLRLYPASFRADYASEMVRTFEESNAHHGKLRATIAAFADVVPNALAAHWQLLTADLKYAARSLRHSRGFALTTILVTALGVGANAATFSVADFVLVRPLSFPNPQDVVRLCEGSRGGGGWGCMQQLSPAVFHDVATRARSFKSLGAFTGTSLNLVGGGEPLRVAAASVTPNVLPLLGVPPLLGRVFDTVSVDAEMQSVVIGYGLWQSHFGGNESVIGNRVTLDGTPYVVIGVMPSHFRFPSEDTQLWTPRVFRSADYENRNDSFLDGVGRLAPGVTFEQARAELSQLALAMEREHPTEHADMGFSFFRQKDQLAPANRLTLIVLCGASLCMLLLTCANLANLSIARAAGRERELAVRSALGAGRERLVRQMLTESVVLAVLGGVAGGVVAALTLPLLSQLVPASLPIASRPVVDFRVFAFAASFATLTGLGFGVFPAYRAGAMKNFSSLRQGSRGTGRKQRLRTALVAFEVAMSVALLVSSGLLLRAMQRVNEVETGFEAANVLTVNTQLPSPRYDDKARRASFYARVLGDLRAIPGVQSAGYTSGLPLVLTGGISLVLLPGETDRRDGNQNSSFRLVTSGYLETLRIPLLRGRSIADSDVRDAPLVAVVSESFAKRHWHDREAIGMTFSTRGQTRTIVGVVGDIRVRGLERKSEPQLYVPFDQAPDNIGSLYVPKVLAVRSTLSSASLLPSVNRIVHAADPDQPVSNVRALQDVVETQTGTRRAQVRILGALAVLALVLAGVGIHGLLAFTVAERDREFGVRLALGAEPSSVARMIVTEGLRMALFGVIPGIVAAFFAARAMSTLLFGIPPEDPLTVGAAALACFLMAVTACIRPALRAARINPLAALRSE